VNGTPLPAPALLTVVDAAALLGVSESAAWSQIRRTGTLAGIVVVRPTLRTVRVPRAALVRLCDGVQS